MYIEWFQFLGAVIATMVLFLLGGGLVALKVIAYRLYVDEMKRFDEREKERSK